MWQARRRTLTKFVMVRRLAPPRQALKMGGIEGWSGSPREGGGIMPRGVLWLGALVLGVGLLAGTPARAFITRDIPLRDFLKGSQFIVTAKVAAVYPERPALLLDVDEDLKGKVPFRQLPVNFAGEPS